MTITPQEPIENNIEFLPSLPATINHVLAVTSNPESTTADLLAAILPDQSMCAAILKIANSAFFGMPREVSSLERAVIVLGQREIRNIVIGRAVFNAFPQLSRARKEDVGVFWEHSFCCGLLAMIIGQSIKSNTGEMFIAGLIHDIGRLPLLIAYPETYLLIRNLNDPYQGEGERKLYGTTHSQIGRNLTHKWLFPEQLIVSTGFHHQPAKAPGTQLYPALIGFSDALILLHLHERIPVEEIFPRISSDMPDVLSLLERHQIMVTPEKIEKWLTELEERRESDRMILDLLTAP